MLTSILTCGLTITSCSNNDTPSSPTDEVEAQLAKMTLREKVGQMFFVRMETLDTTIHWNAYSDLQDNPILEVNKTMRDVNANYPIGGLILYAWNIDDETQLAKLIPQIRALNGNPLLCIVCHASPTTPNSTSRSMSRWQPSVLRETRTMPTSVATPSALI